MEIDKNIINEEQISYEQANMIKEHAKEYEFTVDKKEFLKNISAYEQKLVLLESKNPYEVLNFLEELDLKNLNLVLDNLDYSEITSILQQFTSEDKKKFYERFSHLELVNQFIKYDKNSKEYVDDLSFNRKVDLLDSSNSETVEASTKVYDSMTETEQVAAQDKISTSDGITALYDSSSYDESTLETVESNLTENRESIKENEEGNEAKENVEETKEESKENNQNKEKIEEKVIKENVKKLEDKSIKPDQNNNENNDLNSVINDFDKAKEKAELNEIAIARVQLSNEEEFELEQVKTM